MKKILVGYISISGNTEKMAQWIAEGVRITGHQAEVKKITAMKDVKELEGFDGYIFGSPTYHRDMVEPMKTFLFMAKKGITQHVPLVIWLDGKSSVPVNGKEIKFVGFPTGSGPAFFQGKWTMNGLQAALDQITSNK
jgi:flavodoxin